MRQISLILESAAFSKEEPLLFTAISNEVNQALNFLTISSFVLVHFLDVSLSEKQLITVETLLGDIL